MTYPTTQPLKIKIEGTDRTSLIPTGSIEIRQEITQRIDTARFTVKDVGPKIVDDETGVSWGPTNHHLSLADGSAFIRTVGLDLASLYGGAAGDTDYRIDLYDSNGYLAQGYIEAADAAEALGSELLSNTGFETAGAGGADVFANWVEDAGSNGSVDDETSIVHGGSHACKMTGADDAADTNVYQIVSVTAGSLYKVTFWTRGDGSNPGRYGVRRGSENMYEIAYQSTGITGTSYTEFTFYFTASSGQTTMRLYLYPNHMGGVAYFDDVSVKEVTDVGVTGVHIVDGRDSTTRDWVFVDLGFYRNDSSYTMNILSLSLGISELDSVVISSTNEATRYFAGYITAIEARPRGVFLDLDCTCQDYTYLLERTIIHAEYEDTADTAILSDLFDKYQQLIDPTVYVDSLLAATDLPLEQYNRISLRQVVERLADQGQGDWYVDYGPAAPEEFLTDGDMEDDPTNTWTASNATLAEETGSPHAGAKALKVTATADYGVARQDITVVPGRVYDLDVWVKCTSGDTYYIRVYDVTNSAVVYSTTGTDTTWTEVTQEFTAPADCVSIRLSIGCRYDTDIIYYDDASIKRANQLANLHYFATETKVAPYGISDAPDLDMTFPAEGLVLSRDATDHTNLITIIGGDYLSADTDYIFSADGTQTIILLPYEFDGPDGYDVPRVYKNTGTDPSPVWTEQTVGLEYVDDPASYNVLFNRSEKHLIFATAPSNLTSSVKVTARYTIPLRQRVRNQASYDDYGLWLEDVIVDEDIVDTTVAKELGKAELARRDVYDVVRCVVREPGLIAGQTIRVVNEQAEINAYFSILTVVTRFIGGGQAEFDLEMSRIARSGGIHD